MSGKTGKEDCGVRFARRHNREFEFYTEESGMPLIYFKLETDVIFVL